MNYDRSNLYCLSARTNKTMYLHSVYYSTSNFISMCIVKQKNTGRKGVNQYTMICRPKTEIGISVLVVGSYFTC
jgi:hypothetical protein